MKWYKVEIHTDKEALDSMLYLLETVGIDTAVIEDPTDEMWDSRYKGDWDYSEDLARVLEYDHPVIRVFIEETEDINHLVESINEFLNTIENNGLKVGEKRVTYEIVDDDIWKDKWKEYFKPFKIGNKIVIKPSWEDYTSEDDIVIEMDPGSAFGSGTHETTSLCVELLEEVIRDDNLVYDIGCGTGILGICAAKFGAKKVLGVDISEDAIIATNENIKKNHLIDIMEAKKGSLTEVLEEKADVIVANIIADIIIKMNEDIEAFIKRNGYYIVSGIVDGREKDVITSLKEHNFTIEKMLQKGDWHAILGRYHA